MRSREQPIEPQPGSGEQFSWPREACHVRPRFVAQPIDVLAKKNQTLLYCTMGVRIERDIAGRRHSQCHESACESDWKAPSPSDDRISPRALDRYMAGSVFTEFFARADLSGWVIGIEVDPLNIALNGLE